MITLNQRKKHYTGQIFMTGHQTESSGAGWSLQGRVCVVAPQVVDSGGLSVCSAEAGQCFCQCCHTHLT